LSNSAASSASLVALNPLPEYARAPFNGRVLDQIDSAAFGDPVARAAFSLLLTPAEALGLAAPARTRLRRGDVTLSAEVQKSTLPPAVILPE
jgi:hypothetical protein